MYAYLYIYIHIYVYICIYTSTISTYDSYVGTCGQKDTEMTQTD